MTLALNRTFFLCLLTALFALIGSAFAQPVGVYREVYTDITGSSVANLTNAPTFPNSPSTDELITNYFEAPQNAADNFGQRMRALITPPVTGNYVFWISSDDNGQLWLGTNDNPASRRLIATVNTFSSSRQWTKETNQMSAPVPLLAGQPYFIEALAKEGSGGDNLAVRWQLPTGWEDASNTNLPIPASRLRPFGMSAPVFATHPTNTIVVEHQSATFSAALSRSAGVRLQWQRNGFDIPDASAPTYTVDAITLLDDGAMYRCVASNALGLVTSSNALLSVTPDVTRPTIVSASSLDDPSTLLVLFSEEVEAATALNITNYLIGGVTILAAEFGPDGRTVVLTASGLTANGSYTLNVQNVKDRAATPNTIAPSAQLAFSLTPIPLPPSMVKPRRETIGPSSRRSGLVISEIMYRPPELNGRELEFVEVYNSNPWFEELGGYRISGAISFTFPSNFVLGARSFAVLAKNPSDVQTAYGISGVLGPWEGSLENKAGTLRLRNAQGAVLFESDYGDEPPFPSAADGAGHSLVLGRPSFGERDARAWLPSDVVGGSPGTNEPSVANPYSAIVINEFLAHTDDPQSDYIELFNYSTNAMNLAGCSLSDTPSTNKFIFPANTVIPAGGFVVVDEPSLGFALSAAGEQIIFRNQQGRVIDALRFGPQENSVPSGRSPDGASLISRLGAATPGSNNAAILQPVVVINEIMYHPVSDNPEEEFIELRNTTDSPVSVAGWRLADAVTFTIPQNTVIPAGGYLVVGRNAARLRTQYASLTSSSCIGDWQGSLRDSGERLALTKADDVVSTNALGGLATTNKIHVVVDEVSYRNGGRWGKWSAGDGSSLERRDPRADGRVAAAWGDSDESRKSQWVTVEATGVMTNGWSTAHQLHITLLGAGECLIDNVEVISSAGINLVSNGTFESGSDGWVVQGNHNETRLASGQGIGGGNALLVRATARGDSGANRVRTELPAGLVGGNTVTIRARARWMKGNPNLLLRLRGNWMEALGFTLATANLGTPGAANSIATTNAAPMISDVAHWPLLPATNQPVTVTAQVSDPDHLATLLLRYRIDPATNYVSVAMVNNGAGYYSGTIPGQQSNVLAAFYIQAADKHGATSLFPEDAPARECLVLWGDTVIPGTLGTYRFLITRTNVARWSTEEKMSNKARDVTFVYGNDRVIYNAGAWFHGSPYHSPSYNSPVGNPCDYDLSFPRDERLLGDTEINLYRPGNGGGDATGQAEMHGYWFGHQFGIPFLHNRPVFVIVNGQLRRQGAANVILDAQQPNGDFVEQWFPDDSEGDLHKIQIGFEFGNDAYGSGEPGFATVGANFNRHLTAGGAYFRPRYRATLPRRAAPAFEQTDYTNVFALVEAAMTTAPLGSAAYTTTLTNATDVHHWYKVHVTQHLYENTDSFSYGGGQNAFMYKPASAPWKLLLWDIDFAFGAAGTNIALFGIGGADHGPRNDHAPFRRIYWQYLEEAVNSFMTQARSFPLLDARYNGLIASGAAVSAPNNIKNFINNKRAVILSQLATVPSPFSVSNGGTTINVTSNLVTLTGVAPIEVRHIEVNGVRYTPTWSTITNWSLVLALPATTNSLVIVGKDRLGNIFSNATASIAINVTAPPALPHESVVFNEIMYAPKEGGAEYIELFNRSTTTSFDLSRWTINGADYIFPDGTILGPRQYIVVSNDRFAYTNTHGTSSPLLDSYAGSLQGNGETLTLSGPQDTGAATIDKVRYDSERPWPEAARNTGSSLQLIDSAQANERVANWMADYAPGVWSDPIFIPESTNVGWRQVSVTGTYGSDARLLMFLDFAGTLHLDDISLVLGTNSATGSNFIRNGDFESPLTTNEWVFGTNMTESTLVSDRVRSGTSALRLVQSSAGNASAVRRDLLQTISPKPLAGQTCTLSFWYFATNIAATNFSARIVAAPALTVSTNIWELVIASNYIPPQVIVPEMVLATPGGSNTFATNLAAFPPLWLNEVMTSNRSGILDNAGEREPWVEIYNNSTNAVALDGLFLADNFTNLLQWPFPAGIVIGARQFRVVYLDGETNETTAAQLHSGFRPSAGLGRLALSRISNGTTHVLDYVNYHSGPDISYGSYPDGQPFDRQEFHYPTPGITNNGTFPPVTIFINEWLADNLTTLADPADGHYEDWFELYNPGTNSVSLGGYFLSDTLTNRFKYQIPPGYSIPAGGFLLVFADGEPSQNSGSRPDLHADFSLAKSGESIGLYTPAGLQVDVVSFGLQTTDVSMGRYRDGSASVYSMTNHTPRAQNVLAEQNLPPVIAPMATRFVIEGQTVSVTPSISDPNFPAQVFTWSPIAIPGGAILDANTGTFAWQPSEMDGGSNFRVMFRATDSGTPPLSATQAFTVMVIDTNSAPQLSMIQNQSVTRPSSVSITAVASDPDWPQQNLAFGLDPGAPDGATIDVLTGEFTWTPSAAHGPATYPVTIRVFDDGNPVKTDSTQFFITVTEEPEPPSPQLAATLTNGVVTLTWTTTLGRTFRIEHKASLSDSEWTSLGTNVPGTSGTAWINDPIGTNVMRVYRAVLLP